MTLRFEVNQAEAFRRGVDVPKSVNHLDVNPAKLSQEDRNLIADRLDGIDVCRLGPDRKKLRRQLTRSEENAESRGAEEPDTAQRVVAKLPTYAALMEAIREDETLVQAEEAKRLAGDALKAALSNPKTSGN